MKFLKKIEMTQLKESVKQITNQVEYRFSKNGEGRNEMTY